MTQAPDEFADSAPDDARDHAPDIVSGEPSVPAPLLDPIEERVLGCLIEKAATTPEYYPMSLNALTNVHAVNSAVGSVAGSAAIAEIDYAAEGNFGGVSLSDAAEGERVQIATIDDLPMAHCHLIKIDVEGMELDVLQGAAETVAKHRPALYIENDRKDKSPELIAHLLGADYRLFWHRPPLYNPDNYFANQENAFAELISQNMFCLPVERNFEVAGLVEITSPEVGQGRG